MQHTAHLVVHQPLCNLAPGMQSKGDSAAGWLCLPVLRAEIWAAWKTCQKGSSAAALHQHHTAFYPIGRYQMLLYIFCLAADLPKCTYRNLVSHLPGGISPDPAESRPCEQCMPHLAKASVGAQSQPAGKKQQTIISHWQWECCTLPTWYVWAKGMEAWFIGWRKTMSDSLQQGFVCFAKSGEAVQKAFNT